MTTPPPLPDFRYHPDPIASGSLVPSDAECACCGKSRGYVYAGPVYAEAELDDAICPWCIHEGKAEREFAASFVDSEAFDDAVPDDTVELITERTPGFSTWQGEVWPSCCDDATAFQKPLGLTELRARHRELEGEILAHIVHTMGISGGAATRTLESLHRDTGPTLYFFRCLTCQRAHFHIDQP